MNHQERKGKKGISKWAKYTTPKHHKKSDNFRRRAGHNPWNKNMKIRKNTCKFPKGKVGRKVS